MTCLWHVLFHMVLPSHVSILSASHPCDVRLLEGAVPACWRGKKWKLLLCKTGYKQAKGVPFQRFPFYKLKYSFCVFLSLCRCISLETPDEYEHIGFLASARPKEKLSGLSRFLYSSMGRARFLQIGMKPQGKPKGNCLQLAWRTETFLLAAEWDVWGHSTL